MTLLGKTFHEINDRILQAAMMGDVLFPASERRSGWKMAEKKKVGGFQIRRALAQLFDADAAIFKDTTFSVDVADGGFGCRNSGKAGHEIMRHEQLPPYSAPPLTSEASI
jgi:hypothetical protein